MSGITTPAPNDNTAPTPTRAWLRALETTAQATRDPERILPRAVTEWARKYGDATALVSDRESFSFRGLEARMNQYSRWALSAGVTSGETVALMMGNRPEYFAIWLGLTQVGAIVALISPDLRAPAVAHALKVARARRVIAAAECADVCAEAVAGLDDAIEILDPWGAAVRTRIELTWRFQTGAASRSRRTSDDPITLADRALRIFTSGTTGLPKAAEVSHRRLIVWSHWFAGLAGLTATDRLYNCLPMHHSVGGVVAIGAPLVFGGSVAIAERFSARGFWDDVARWECTAFQYIGELCRYLVAAPGRPEEKAHRLRLAIGNGLSEEVWRAVLDRFGPLRVLEFYASTEGNVWLYNVEGKIGSIGRVPPYLALARPDRARAFRPQFTNARARRPTVFARAARTAKSARPWDASAKIPALASRATAKLSRRKRKSCATSSRRATRGCEPATSCVATPTASIRSSIASATLFAGRARTSRRSKSRAVLRACPGVAEAIVYGVSVPGADGRAGMALLKIDGQFDLDALVRRLETLPRYARPLFLRLAREIETTETFKPKRRVYVEQGFDPERVEDPLYVFERERQAYVPLDANRHEAIRNGTMRL